MWYLSGLKKAETWGGKGMQVSPLHLYLLCISHAAQPLACRPEHSLPVSQPHVWWGNRGLFSSNLQYSTWKDHFYLHQSLSSVLRIHTKTSEMLRFWGERKVVRGSIRNRVALPGAPCLIIRKENAPLKIWGLQEPNSKCFPGGHGLRCSPFLNSLCLKIDSYEPDTTYSTSPAFPFQSFTLPILQMSQLRLHNLPKIHSLKVTEPYFDQVWIQEPTWSPLCQGYST